MNAKLCLVLVATLNLAAGASFGYCVGRSSVTVEVRAGEPDADLVTLADVLDLPADRKEKVRAILASCAPRFEDVMKDARPKLRAIHDQILGELRQVLTEPELSRLADEYRRRHGSRPPHELR
jgi:hypothetical protein